LRELELENKKGAARGSNYAAGTVGGRNRKSGRFRFGGADEANEATRRQRKNRYRKKKRGVGEELFTSIAREIEKGKTSAEGEVRGGKNKLLRVLSGRSLLEAPGGEERRKGGASSLLIMVSGGGKRGRGEITGLLVDSGSRSKESEGRKNLIKGESRGHTAFVSSDGVGGGDKKGRQKECKRSVQDKPRRDSGSGIRFRGIE